MRWASRCHTKCQPHLRSHTSPKKSHDASRPNPQCRGNAGGRRTHKSHQDPIRRIWHPNSRGQGHAGFRQLLPWERKSKSRRLLWMKRISDTAGMQRPDPNPILVFKESCKTHSYIVRVTVNRDFSARRRNGWPLLSNDAYMCVYSRRITGWDKK